MSIYIIALKDTSLTSKELRYGLQKTHHGIIIVAVRNRYICSLFFVDQENHEYIVTALQNQWKNCIVLYDQLLIDSVLKALSFRESSRIDLLVSGTHFQRTVWSALLTIPSGTTCSYSKIAQDIGRPTAVRAVARAIACNPIAYLIPCHRVILHSGKIHAYRWGVERKRRLLAYEAEGSSALLPL